MSKKIKSLINELTAIAKKRGISQKKLAQQVGITAVGFSKAKKRGDIRASNLALLARELGLELALVPGRQKEKARRAIKSGGFFDVNEAGDS